jgi:RHS repeat-associated protein
VGSVELGLYDYGFRFYDPQIGRFTTNDPLAEKHFDYTPYNYVGNNPIKRIDLLGLDWFTDKDGSYQYDPKINDKSKLQDGQKYVGKTYQVKNKDGKITTNYRKDGSIFYSNQKDAFNRLDANSKKKGVEEFAALTKNGGALVTPDYKNDKTECNPVTRYGYSFKDGNIVDADGKTFNTEATIHTHYGDYDPEPSGTQTGEGDLETLSRYTPNKPILTMGGDGKVYGVFGSYNKNGKLNWNWVPYSGDVQVKDIMQKNNVLKDIIESYIYGGQ